MNYGWLLFTATALALIFTPVARSFARRFGFMDVPRPPRNLHAKSVSKLGGAAVYLAVSLTIVAYVLFGGIDHTIVPMKFLIAILLGGLVLVLGGAIDDKYDLPAKYLWIFPAVASAIVVFAGIGVGIKFLSNPFGAPISLDFALLGVPASGIFIFIWMMGMMFTTKFLDGLDGLVGGIGLIAALTLFGLSLTEKVNQPITASLAIILVGALLGYLVYASHPASIFFGEGGSTFVGFMLGVLSVILGGKIATALLVMGIPILDVAWVIAQRIWHGKSPFLGDRLHLHFKILDLGFSQKQTVLIMYAISGIFGFTAVFLQSLGKLVALGILFVVMGVFILALLYAYRKQQLANR